MTASSAAGDYTEDVRVIEHNMRGATSRKAEMEIISILKKRYVAS